MKKTNIIVAISLCLILANNSYAYLDPGTGSYVIQVVLALFVGAAFSLKLYWAKVTSAIRKIFKFEERD